MAMLLCIFYEIGYPIFDKFSPSCKIEKLEKSAQDCFLVPVEKITT